MKLIRAPCRSIALHFRAKPPRQRHIRCTPSHIRDTSYCSTRVHLAEDPRRTCIPYPFSTSPSQSHHRTRPDIHSEAEPLKQGPIPLNTANSTRTRPGSPRTKLPTGATSRARKMCTYAMPCDIVLAAGRAAGRRITPAAPPRGRPGLPPKPMPRCARTRAPVAHL